MTKSSDSNKKNSKNIPKPKPPSPRSELNQDYFQRPSIIDETNAELFTEFDIIDDDFEKPLTDLDKLEYQFNEELFHQHFNFTKLEKKVESATIKTQFPLEPEAVKGQFPPESVLDDFKGIINTGEVNPKTLGSFADIYKEWLAVLPVSEEAFFDAPIDDKDAGSESDSPASTFRFFPTDYPEQQHTQTYGTNGPLREAFFLHPVEEQKRQDNEVDDEDDTTPNSPNLKPSTFKNLEKDIIECSKLISDRDITLKLIQRSHGSTHHQLNARLTELTASIDSYQLQFKNIILELNKIGQWNTDTPLHKKLIDLISKMDAFNQRILAQFFLYYRFIRTYYERKHLSDDYDCRYRSDWPQPFIGKPAATALLIGNHSVTQSDDVKETILGSSIAASISGFLLGVIIACIARPFYPNKKPMDPLYRSCKTAACVGLTFGKTLSLIIPTDFLEDFLAPVRKIAAEILGCVFSFIFGLAPIVLWPFRSWWYKGHHQHEPIEPTSTRDERLTRKRGEETLLQTNDEGWSKFGKTALVYGLSLGALIAAFLYGYTHILDASVSAAKIDTFSDGLMYVMTCGGCIGGLALFTAAMILVPLINYLKKNALLCKSKEDFRNNYPRAGITVGAAIFSILGYFIGTYFLPILSSMGGLTLGAAIGGVIGGPFLTVYGKKITNHVRGKWRVIGETDNSWDYAVRTMANVMAFLGTFLGFFIHAGVANSTLGVAFLWPTLLGCIGNIVGAGLGLVIVYIARNYGGTKEEKAEKLNWSQRLNDRANIGVVFGSLMGIAIGCGLLGMPLTTAFLLATQLGALGGFLGGMWGSFDDKAARNTWIKVFFTLKNKLFGPKHPSAKLQKITPANHESTPTNSPRPAPAVSTHYEARRLFSAAQTAAPTPERNPITGGEEPPPLYDIMSPEECDHPRLKEEVRHGSISIFSPRGQAQPRPPSYREATIPENSVLRVVPA